jgi:ATP-dependent Clp protease adaptor protein ClpS
MAQKRSVLENDGETLVKKQEYIKEPRHYTIVLHNDDFTTQEFVVHVLISFLYQPEPKALEIMLKVHKEGKARVGRFIKDIAETKASMITSYSRKNDMPLLVTIEPL